MMTHPKCFKCGAPATHFAKDAVANFNIPWCAEHAPADAQALEPVPVIDDGDDPAVKLIKLIRIIYHNGEAMSDGTRNKACKLVLEIAKENHLAATEYARWRQNMITPKLN